MTLRMQLTFFNSQIDENHLTKNAAQHASIEKKKCQSENFFQFKLEFFKNTKRVFLSIEHRSDS